MKKAIFFLIIGIGIGCLITFEYLKRNPEHVEKQSWFETTKEASKDGYESVKDKTKDLYYNAGDHIENATQSAKKTAAKLGEKGSETTIRLKILSKFKLEKGFDESQIEVEVNGEVVTFRGWVDSKSDEQKAIEIALGTKGVDTVKSKLRSH